MVEEFIPKAYDVHVNVLYFVSLILSLSVSSVCILAKQWIREFQKDLAVSSKDAVRVRQARFDALKAWKVPQIIASLPVLLLAALMLFFAGLLVQLWNVSDHTTAIAASVFVASTALVVFVTTVIPAYRGMQPGRSSFTPFRSPQSWTFFVIHRRIQQWCDDLFNVWNRRPPLLSSWAEFDMHFLAMETTPWVNHKISSVHRALRWVLHVLRNSSEMEQAVLWCLQPQYHPKGLIESDSQLNSYVLSDYKGHRSSQDLHLAYYEYSVASEREQSIDTAPGRHQAEMLIRSAHTAIDNIKSGDEGAWTGITAAASRLQFCGIFVKLSNTELIPGMCNADVTSN